MMREITKKQFDAYCYSRQPLVRAYTREIAWFEAAERKLLAFIIFDRTDSDFGHIILGRDARHLFRCINVSNQFFPTPEEAYADLEKDIALYINDGQDFYPQGDEAEPPYEIFKPVVPEERQHPYFKILSQERRFEAARNLIKEIAFSFVDVDGNYIQQFQSDGFDARLWELYLYVYLYNSGFELDHSFQSPDYCINKLGYECCIEAVTVGPNPDFDAPNAVDAKDIIELSKNYLPIKYGSALYSKLNKKPPYWEMEHVKGKPFILAVHDYHKPADVGVPGSMTWTRAGLSNYLYGIRDEVEIGPDGRVRPVLTDTGTVKMAKTDQHTYKHKTIPSKFFNQPNAENISAILYSNAATVTTFNRMGKLAGLGSKDVIMIRRGMKAHVDPESFFPVPFAANIDDPNYEEAWGDSIVMYHNPNALYPVDPDAFPEISHVNYDEEIDEFVFIPNPNEVFSSVTVVLVNRERSWIKTLLHKAAKIKNAINHVRILLDNFRKST